MISTTLAQKWILYTALLFAFSLPISRAGINVFGAMLLVIWLLEGRFNEKFYAIIQHKFTLALSLFLIYMFVVILWVEPDNITLAYKYNLKYSYFLIVFVLFTSYDKEKAILLFYAFLLGMFVSILQSLSIYFNLYAFKEINADSLSPHMWHTIYSLFLAFSALMSLVFLLETKTVKHKILFAIFYLSSTTVLFLGISRTGQLIYLLGLLLTMIRFFKPNWKSLLLAPIMIVILLGTLYSQNALFKSRIDIAKSDINSFQQNRDYCTSIGGRIFTWEVAYNVFKSDPILGLGTVDHIEYLKKSIEDDPQFSQCSIKNLIGYYHAQYIELTAQSGLVGLFFLLSLFITLWLIPIKNQSISSMKNLLILLFLIAFFLDVPFRKMFTVALFALISSILLLQERVENEI